MADFSTFDDVDAYAKEHGIDGLRMMVYQGSITGQRKQLVEYYLQHHDKQQVLEREREIAIQRESQAVESLAAAKTSAAAAVKSADATERAAVAAEKSAKFSAWAVIAALVAMVVTIGLARCG